MTKCRVEQQDHRESIAPLKRHSLLEPGQVSPRLEVPLHIPRPPYVGSIKPPPYAEQVQIQDLAGIAGMRAAGELAARVLKFAGTLVKVDTFPSLSVYHNAILLLKSINRVSNPKP